MLEESTGNFSASRNIYDWYQTQTHVILNVMIKNLNEADVKVRLIDETLDVSCDLADGSLFKLHFNLYKPIYVAESNWSVTPSKLEIKLKKTDKKRWQSLEVIPEKSNKRLNTGNSFQTKKQLITISNYEENLNTDNTASSSSSTTTNATSTTTVTTAVSPTQNEATLKHDWFQDQNYVYVNIHARNINPNDVSIVFTDTYVDIYCKLSDDSDIQQRLNLFNPIIAEESSYQVTLSKLEIKMRKIDSRKWKNIEAVPFMLKNCNNNNNINSSNLINNNLNNKGLISTTNTYTNSDDLNQQSYMNENNGDNSVYDEGNAAAAAVSETSTLNSDHLNQHDGHIIVVEDGGGGDHNQNHLNQIIQQNDHNDQRQTIVVINQLKDEITFTTTDAAAVVAEFANQHRVFTDSEGNEIKPTIVEGGDVDLLLKEIYEKGNDEVRFAMNKTLGDNCPSDNDISSSATIVVTGMNDETISSVPEVTEETESTNDNQLTTTWEQSEKELKANLIENTDC